MNLTNDSSRDFNMAMVRTGIDCHSTHTMIKSFLSSKILKPHIVNWISLINQQVHGGRVDALPTL
jgi:hypothetical protein